MEEDRISSLSDEIICHILSFLDTEDAFTTSLLSKRWNPLWLLVPTLDLHEYRMFPHYSVSLFPKLVFAAIFKRSVNQPIKKLCLSVGSYDDHHLEKVSVLDYDIESWLTGAAERKLEHLEFDFIIDHYLPCCIFSFRNLVVLKLKDLTISTASHVDFPLLKTLHLYHVDFDHRWFVFKLFSGCPVLEDFEANLLYIYSSRNMSTSPDRVLKCLPKLVRAKLSEISEDFPLEPFCSVESLHLEEVEYYDGLFPTFSNLTQLVLVLISLDSWQSLVDVLNHCPKLQKLELDQVNALENSRAREYDLENWVDQDFVPQCLSLHLTTCNIFNYYGGQEGELLLARYILKNARVLQTMTIWNICFKIKGKLSSYPRASATCKVAIHDAPMYSRHRPLI